MFGLIPLLTIPLLVMLGFKVIFQSTFTLKEFLLSETIMAVVICIGFFGGRWGALQDTEIWSGHLTEKTHGSQSCCHCRQECDTCYRTDSNGKTESYECNCREVCDHIRDYWWALEVSTGDTISIKRCEPWKSRVPAVWTNARVGEPAAVEHGFTNYLLADPDSVFDHRDDEADYSDVPRFPRVHGTYRINSALNLGTRMPVSAYNEELMLINDDLGAKKQTHIVVVATTERDASWALHMEEAWLHGKKNSVTFVLGAPDGDNIEWARVFSISHIAKLQITARDKMPGLKLSDVDAVLGFIEGAVQRDFTRTHMSEYEYLASAAKPPFWLTILLYILGIGGAVGLSLIMHHTDVFGEDRYNRYRRF